MIWSQCCGGGKPAYQAAEDERRASGDFSEMV